MPLFIVETFLHQKQARNTGKIDFLNELNLHYYSKKLRYYSKKFRDSRYHFPSESQFCQRIIQKTCILTRPIKTAKAANRLCKSNDKWKGRSKTKN